MSADAGIEGQENTSLENVLQGDTEGGELTYGGSQEENTNPAWSEILNDIPEGFRGQVEPHLKRWDEQVKSQFESRAEELRQAQEQLNQYQPYADFVQSGADPQQIKAGHVLVQELMRDPKAFYQRIGDHYGFSQEQIDQAVREHDPDNYDDDEEQQQFNDPRFDQLAQQQQHIAQYIEQQANQQMQQQANQQIEDELTALNSQIEGGLSDIDRRETLQRAILMGQTNPNVTLVEAYNQWQNVKRQMFENTQTKQAPRVVSSGGSANPATPVKKPSEMSDDEFKSDIVNQLMNLKG